MSRHERFGEQPCLAASTSASFAGAKSGEHGQRIAAWCAEQKVGQRPDPRSSASRWASNASSGRLAKQHRDSAAPVTIKLLDAASVLTFDLSDS